MATITTALSWSASAGSNPFPPPLGDAIPNAVPSEQQLTLAAGDTTVSFPPGTTRILLMPPAGNAALLRIKGAAGDTGIGAFKAAPQYLAFDGAAPASIVINASALMTAPLQVISA